MATLKEGGVCCAIEAFAVLQVRVRQVATQGSRGEGKAGEGKKVGPWEAVASCGIRTARLPRPPCDPSCAVHTALRRQHGLIAAA